MTVTPLRPPGRVSLVGAGPGDPELLTVRGLRRLREADCVLYDRLAGAALLAEVRPGCELMAVGKTPGVASPGAAIPGARAPGAEAPGAEATAQEDIHRLLVDRARRGLRVVRLKGGDPYVFGRGFEEVAALRAAGVEVEVVPGISSALAGPAAAGIPLTERLRAASFAVVTGHRAPAIDGGRGDEGDDGDDGIDWPALARVDTLVVLMGVGRLRAICERLLACGKDPATPAAIVENATLVAQREVRARLDELAAAAEAAAIRAPAVLVVGPTVRLTARAAGPRFAPTLDHPSISASISNPTRTASTGELR
jgi:uroporphyrin-III C-methyltransferase